MLKVFLFLFFVVKKKIYIYILNRYSALNCSDVPQRTRVALTRMLPVQHFLAF